MQEFIDSQGMNQTEFAIRGGTSDKTIRKFRQTGKVKRSILTGIAAAMSISKEELLKP
jgi:DNA transposition AAA+ family ATPase